MDVVRYVERLDESKLNPHQQLLLRNADKELLQTRRKAAMTLVPIGIGLFWTGKHRKPLQRLFTGLAVPIAGMLLAEAYGVNIWLTKRYLLTKSQQVQLNN